MPAVAGRRVAGVARVVAAGLANEAATVVVDTRPRRLSLKSEAALADGAVAIAVLVKDPRRSGVAVAVAPKDSGLAARSVAAATGAAAVANVLAIA